VSVNAFLFSSLDLVANEETFLLLREAGIDMFLEKFNTKQPTVGYIDSGYDICRIQYESVKENLKKLFGLTNVKFLDLTKRYTKEKAMQILNCNIIFLAGGNTFSYLKLLNKRNMIKRLKGIKDKVIFMGVSAGSIIMTEDIRIAHFADKNTCKIKTFESLGLVSFHFKPHWDSWKQYLPHFLDYSSYVNKPVYGCKEGGAIVIYEDEVFTFGDVVEIERTKEVDKEILV
jgi:dipeptidase E